MGQGLASVVDAGTTLPQRWSNLSCLFYMRCTGPVMVLCSHPHWTDTSSVLPVFLLYNYAYYNFFICMVFFTNITCFVIITVTCGVLISSGSKYRHLNTRMLLVCTHITLGIRWKYQNIQNSLICLLKLICNTFCTYTLVKYVLKVGAPLNGHIFRTFHREYGVCMFENERYDKLDLTIRIQLYQLYIYLSYTGN